MDFSLINEAKREVKLADHMLYVTYSLVKDKKLLPNIVTHLINALDNTISFYLNYEHEYKRIKYIPSSPLLKAQLFIQNYKKFNLDSTVLRLFEIEQIMKKSVKFEKNNDLVLVSPHYQVKKVNLSEIKKYLSLIKNLILKVENATK